ncbi:hypothetical protein D4R71_00480 [bacterium]|nr:MAG: hypothetical protein D4R71_00480 [bacterium]
MIKEKSVAYYFADGRGGIRAVSKNAITRMQKKIRSEDFLKPGQVYSIPSHKVIGIKLSNEWRGTFRGMADEKK